MSDDLRQRVSSLEDRVRILERRLAMRSVLHRDVPIPPPAESVALVAPEPSVAPAPPTPPPVPPAPPPALQPRPPSEPVPEFVPHPTRDPVSEPTPPEPPPFPIPAPAWPAPRRVPAPTAFDLERTIGTRWFAAIGAVVVVIGVGLFVRLAYQNGWLNLIPPAGKCISGALFGAALLIAGEFIRRRVSALASAGVSAAGLGALFAASYAAHGIYALLPSPVAFALLAACAALGFVISARGKLVSIGILSLVAAYLNPLIIGQATAGPLVLPAYLIALLCTALALSAWRAVPFRPLRALAWWGTLIYGGLWCTGTGLAHPGAALTFLGVVWALIHTELTLASRHPALAAPATDHDLELSWNRTRFIVTSFTSTAWTAALAIHLVRTGTHIADWWPAAILASLVASLALLVAGDLRILRQAPKTDAERFAAGLAMQAGALVITAVALAFSGWLEIAAWLSLGLAAIAAGRWIRSRGLDIYGLVALAIASARLLAFESPFTSAQPAILDSMGLILTRWSLLMAIGASAWALASRVLRPAPGQHWSTVRTGSLIVALCHLNLALTHPAADAGSVCTAWLFLAILGFLLGRAMRSNALTAYGACVLILSTVRVLFAAPVTGAPSRTLLELGGLVITRWTILMIIGAAAWAIISRLIRPDPASRGFHLRTAAVIVALCHLNLSLIHEGADAGAVCTVWLILAIAGLLLGRATSSKALTVYGTCVLIASTCRFLFAAPVTGAASGVLVEAAGLVITRWSILMWIAAGAWMIAVALLRESPPSSQTQFSQRAALVGIALSMVFAGFLHPHAHAASIANVWLALAVVTALAHSLFRRLRLDVYSIAALAAVTIAWTVAYPARWMDLTSLAPHPGLLSALAIAGAALALSWWFRSRLNPARPTHPQVLPVLLPAALALLFASTSLEVARVAGVLSSEPTARRAAVSIWWGLVAVGLIGAGFWRRVPAARHAGLALLTIATAKAAIFDLAFVPQIWRVASFVGLGLLMLGVAVAYARIAQRSARPSEPR